jgi:RND superfamily putative drug exporter
MTGRLYSLAKFCIRHRRIVMPVWLLLIVAITFLSSTMGSQFADDISLPGRDSQAATDLVDQKFPDQANGTNPIVFKAKDGKITDSANQQAVDKVIKDVTADGRVARPTVRLTPDRRTDQQEPGDRLFEPDPGRRPG